jgi:hypothetical protein
VEIELTLITTQDRALAQQEDIELSGAEESDLVACD